MRPAAIVVCAWAAVAPLASCERPRARDGAVVDAARQSEFSQWTVARVAERLTAAGVSPSSGGVIAQEFLSVGGTNLRVADASDTAEVQVYLYADATAAARDASRLDPVRAAPPTTMIAWVAPPALVVDRNLIAIILSRNAALRDRIRRALMASAPAR